MNKEQAAEYLGITVRTLQRHMAANRISFRGGRDTGKEATFTEADLDRFKADQDALTATVSPVVSPLSENVIPAPQQALQAAFQSQDIAPARRAANKRAGGAAIARDNRSCGPGPFYL